MSHRRPCLVLLALLAACGGDDDGPGADAPAGGLLGEIRGLPEVASVRELTTTQEGYRYFEIHFDQPVDHADPGGARFRQYATLIHTDVTRPMVLLHTGYGNWYYDFPSELTALLRANQLVVEHRFFRGSRPLGTEAWAHLTIEQSAADHHRITQAMRRLYDAPWIETGASKGGMTSVYHRRFYPDDVDATVAYVAPISFAAPDYRYEAHVEQLGPPACRQALRDAQRELLLRRVAMQDRAWVEAEERGYQYARISLAAAVEGAITELEWGFWQYVGASACTLIPPSSATDEELWEFLRAVSPVSSSDDDNLAEFEAYYHQAEVELGYPGTVDEHLADLVTFTDADYAGAYPVGVTRPPYADTAMRDIDDWVQTEGDRLLFLYGEWDPWTGGPFTLGNAQNSMLVTARQAPHGAGIRDLGLTDQQSVMDWLLAATGVVPDATFLQRRERRLEPRALRVPPAVLRAKRLR